MATAQKNEAIEILKEKFSQYSNFYITNTESLTVAQIDGLRRTCFEKNVEMKVAKNTLVRKALESLNNEKYTGIYDSLHGVTALMFSDSPKEPAVILTAFRKASKGERPTLKAAFIGDDLFTGDNQLSTLANIKTKNELIGEVLSLLQSPARRVLAALLHHHAEGGKQTAQEVAVVEAPVAEVVAETSTPEAAAETTPPTE